MINTTTWSPDTCGCTLHYEWDSDLPAEKRVHTPIPFAKRYHVILDDEATQAARKKWHAERDRIHAEVAEEIGMTVEQLRAEASRNCCWLPGDDGHPSQVTKFADTFEVIPSRFCRYHCRYVGDCKTHYEVVLAENQRKNRLRGVLAEHLGIEDGQVGHVYLPDRRLWLVVPRMSARAILSCERLLASIGAADVLVTQDATQRLYLPPWVRRLFVKRRSESATITGAQTN